MSYRFRRIPGTNAVELHPDRTRSNARVWRALGAGLFALTIIGALGALLWILSVIAK